MHNYKELNVWKESIELVAMVYNLTRTLPKDEQYVLVYQLRKSAVSIPSNIAEGAGRRTEKDFAHFLNIAYGSTCELETQLIILSQLNYADDVSVNLLLQKIDMIQKMLYRLEQSLSNKTLKANS